jgi:hypothetical protein
MLVYGDHVEVRNGAGLLAALDGPRADALAKHGLERHSALVSLLIEAGRLWQAVADTDFAPSNADRPTESTQVLARFCREIANAVIRSWNSGFADEPDLPQVPHLAGLPDSLGMRVPEGFAFYAVYPEAYADAARHLKLSAPPRVIGIRSIGTTLSAIVAAALGAPTPVSVRPFGDPFARQIAVAPELGRELLDGDFHYVIVDEGPGLSGSSFGAVADWLEARGIARDRIAFLSSHAGELGPQSSAAHRKRWRSVQRIAVDFGTELPDLIRGWLKPIIGSVQTLVDVSGGGWRPLLDPIEAHWPATVPAWERRKLLARAGGQSFLAKFAGLGGVGELKLAMARELHAEGWTAKPVGMTHGFLIEEWLGDATPLGAGDNPVEEIGRYIGTRANLFPAEASDGASAAALLTMIRRNVSLTLGEAAAEAASLWEAKLASLQSRIVRLRTDNRMLRHEWLRAPDGSLLKADAVDHHAGHDLIGCQDMAWDVAGAIAELELDDEQAAALETATERAAPRRIDPDLLRFYIVAYSAFRLGQLRLGAEMTASDAAEVRRLNREAARFEARLRQLLHQQQSLGTPQQFSAK